MGTVVISVDAALGWAVNDRDHPSIDRVADARSGWRKLLDCFDEHDLPATWNVVGHLLLEDCDGVHEHHPLAPSRFRREREDWADRRDLRFARTLVEAAVGTSADHELGFLPFSHVEFGHDAVETDLARAECAGFFEALPDELPSPRAAAFPHDAVGHRDVLAEWGFDCYRGRAPGRGTNLPLARSARRLVEATVSGPPIVEPTVDEYGLVNVPTSLDLFGFEGRAGHVCERALVAPVGAAVRRGLDRVADSEDGVFHCRLRPSDVVDERDRERIRDVCATIADRRGEDFEVATVGAVAERARSGAEVPWTNPAT